MNWSRKEPIVAYTDGSCRKNPGGPGGWAYVLVQEGQITEAAGHDPATTNNRMELTSAIKALEACPVGSNVYLYTDSTYVQQGISIWLPTWKRRGWTSLTGKPIANQDLWAALDAAASQHLVSWHWVRGHDGNPYNERCDVLASAACNQLPDTLSTNLLTND